MSRNSNPTPHTKANASVTPPSLTSSRGECAPLVTVVIPAFNASATIGETVASVCSQTYEHIEILVIDDGSEDDTAAAVQGIARRDPRIRLLKKANGGLSSARNFGAEHARGPLLAFLDADDLWHPAKLEKQLNALDRSGPNGSLCYTWVAILDEFARFTGEYVTPLHEGDVYAALILTNFVTPGSTALVRTTCFSEVGGFDETLREGCEDLAFCLAVAERFDTVVVPMLLTGYRTVPTSMSHDVAAMARAYAATIARVRARHQRLPSRLLRWSEGFAALWFARRSWRQGRYDECAAMLGRALRRDPAAFFTEIGQTLVRRTIGRPPADPLRGRAFLPPPEKLHGFTRRKLGWLQERRHGSASRISARRLMASP